MKRLFTILLLLPLLASGQINTDQVLRIGQNNLYFEDYVLSIQYFNRVISVKPYLAQPYFLRSVAKLNLDDYLGAEQDATLALERNPFIVDAWEVRGVARQNMGKTREAIDDYTHALSMMPDSRGLLYNKAIAQQDVGELEGADSTYAYLLKRFPGFDGGYLGRARLRLEQKDTVSAKEDIDKALSINRNAVNGYVMRADIAINSRGDYTAALADMDKAIRLQPKYAGFFINRAYLRYMTDDFQGAFADYDYALQLEPDNTMAMFNRGLLRTEVHETDKAIADFSRVLDIDPEDYKALYNRAIILSETGRLDRAIADIDRLLEVFPDFAAAYFLRYDARMRKGDTRGAEKDYNKSLALAKTKVQLDPGGRFTAVPTDSTDTSTAESTSPTRKTETQEQVKRRFSSLNTIADNSQPEQIFNSKEIRGKVQDRNLTIEMEPIFAVTYYSSPTELKMSGDYMREVEEINSTRALRFLLQVTNHEPVSTDEETAQRHFESMAYYNSYLASHTPRAIDYLGRAMDFMTLRDYENAIADLNRAIALTSDFTLAYLIRANAEYLLSRTHHGNAEADPSRPSLPGGQGAVRSAIADLDKVIELSPLMPVAHYNKGVILASEGDFTSALLSLSRAIEIKPDFGEAYYNRGYVYLTLGNKDAAFNDLSKAGSLGIVPSYNLLKRMSVK
ncbi:MAG: tetratricopeptide repeat protein [Muribaculaceae bacterium]|nr:tetratricopeptide repeat protein [Muribaculaceae bacterium]